MRWWGREYTGLDELYHIACHPVRRSTRIGEHAMPCAEALAVVHGEATVQYADGRRLHLVGGHWAVIPPRMVYGSADAPVRGLLYWFGLSPKPGFRVQATPGLTPPETAELEAALAQSHSTILRLGDSMVGALETMVAAVAEGRTLMRRRAAALSLLALAVDGMRGSQADADDALRRQIGPALAAVAADPGGHHPPDALAKLCGMGRTAFSNVFREATGFTPHDFVTRAKVEAAARLMREGQTVVAAAHAVGFSSGQYLSTAFRRVLGMAPTEWVLRHRHDP
jgi:AraC-like DNA-binding protein